MAAKKPETTGEGNLFCARLDRIIHLKHVLVQLGGKIDWDWIDREIAPTTVYRLCERAHSLFRRARTEGRRLPQRTQTHHHPRVSRSSKRLWMSHE